MVLDPGDAGLLAPVMVKVQGLADTVGDDEWLAYLVHVFNWMVEAMASLASYGYFEHAFPGAAVTFWVTDTHAPVDDRIEWIDLMNEPGRSDLYAAFLRRPVGSR